MITEAEKNRLSDLGEGTGLRFDIVDDHIERVVELFTKDTTMEERALLLAFRGIGPSNNNLANRIADELAKSLEQTKGDSEGGRTIVYISGLLAGLAIGQDE